MPFNLYRRPWNFIKVRYLFATSGSQGCNHATTLSFHFSLSPYSFDVSPSCTDVPQVTHDSIPIGAMPILASSTPDYADAVSRTISAANAVYQGEIYLKIANEILTYLFQNLLSLRKVKVSPVKFV